VEPSADTPVRCFAESGDTRRDVFLTTTTYLVDADHANYMPLPPMQREVNGVAVGFTWEFDRITMEAGTAEMRDAESLHYFSVLPPNHVTAFVKMCKKESVRFAKFLWPRYRS
jgi:hypothetical protein